MPYALLYSWIFCIACAAGGAWLYLTPPSEAVGLLGVVPLLLRIWVAHIEERRLP